jgi:phosphohistidine phosphatase
VELYLLRHGVAEQNAPSGRDIDRTLTPGGITGLKNVVARASTAGLRPNRIAASPYLRAQQSAQIVADLLGYREPILTSTRLTPDSSPASLWQEVREIADGSLLIVSHEPLLSNAAAWFTGDTRGIIEFNPATLVRIDFETLGPAPLGHVRWKMDGI